MIGKLLASAAISITFLSAMAATIFNHHNISLSSFSNDELFVHGLVLTGFAFAATINLFSLMGGMRKNEEESNEVMVGKPLCCADE